MKDEDNAFDEWQASETEDARWETEFAEGNASERKYQLYAAAWCRRIWSLFPYDCCRHVVETLERVADGLRGESDLKAAWDLFEALPGPDPHAGLNEAQSHAHSAAVTCVMDKENRLATVAELYCREAIKASQGPTPFDLIREMICNPSRSVSIANSWVTPQVLALAQTAYDNRQLPSGTLDNDRLAILADALEDAGWENADILGHLRSAGPHVRGCFALDLILGKE